MLKIKRIDAVRELIIAIDTGEIEKANEILKIIMRTIDSHKKNKKMTNYVELQNKQEEVLFVKKRV